MIHCMMIEEKLARIKRLTATINHQRAVMAMIKGQSTTRWQRRRRWSRKESEFPCPNAKAKIATDQKSAEFCRQSWKTTSRQSVSTLMVWSSIEWSERWDHKNTTNIYKLSLTCLFRLIRPQFKKAELASSPARSPCRILHSSNRCLTITSLSSASRSRFSTKGKQCVLWCAPRHQAHSKFTRGFDSRQDHPGTIGFHRFFFKLSRDSCGFVTHRFDRDWCSIPWQRDGYIFKQICSLLWKSCSNWTIVDERKKTLA